MRGRDTSLLLTSGLEEEDAVRLAIGLYALYRTVNSIRFAREGVQMDVDSLLRLFAKRAVDKHSSKALLQWT